MIPDALIWMGGICLVFALMAFVAEQLERKERHRRIEQAHRRNVTKRRIDQ